MIRIAREKIIRFNPRRYYLFSSADINTSEMDKINEEIKKIKQEHGCQVIVNGILPTRKYYLRLLSSLEDFINNYSQLIEDDSELQAVHKVKWNEILWDLENK